MSCGGGGRPETGPMQFGEDWPGVFIRGDNAAGYWMDLALLLKYLESKADAPPLAVFHLRSLQALLGSGLVREGKVPDGTQQAGEWGRP